MSENPFAALPQAPMPQADLARLEAELAATEAQEALAATATYR